MTRVISLLVLVTLHGTASAEDWIGRSGGAPVQPLLSSTAMVDEGALPHLFADGSAFFRNDVEDLTWLDIQQPWTPVSELVVRGQDSGSGGGAGGGSGAAAATDPTVPLAQMQFQNVFTPESFDSSGYSNQFVLQPVLPLHINEHGFFPFHILRPTLPIIAPTADPIGPAGVQGGLGDTAVLDVFMHPMKEIKTTVGFGYTAVLPTATHPQLGLGEWKLGPTAVVMITAIPKWNIGLLYQQPYSLQSNAYQVQVQPIIVRTLPKAWYVGWGDLLWKLDDENGEYDIPINLRVGKVVTVGKHKLNIFVEPYYTPPGLHSGTGGSHRSRGDGNGGGSSWGVKLNVTLLFPEAKLFAPLLSRLNGCGDCYCP